MAKVNLKSLLENYTKNLCGKMFEYSVYNKTTKSEDRIVIRFFTENFCHLLGLQHIYDDNTSYLGESGYTLISEESITTSSLKQHNEKAYNFIKIKLKHFDEIYDIIKYGKLISFKPELCYPHTKITADFLLVKDNTTYLLHLFLRNENPPSNLYIPVSFVVHTEKDCFYKQYIKEQTYKRITYFEEKKILIPSMSKSDPQ